MQRSEKQNRSLHLYARLLAQQLADAGLDMRQIITVPIQPTTENVKETMIKPIMTALYPDKTSTTELSTTEIQNVYENCNAATADRLGVSVVWPSKEDENGKNCS